MSPVFYETRNEPFFAGSICEYPYPTHVHDMAEIVCLRTGRIKMTVSGVAYTILPGDIIAVFPSQTHSYDYVSEDAHGLSMIFPPDTIMQFSRLFHTMSPAQPNIRKEQVSSELNQVIDRMLAFSDSDPMMIRQAYLHLFLAHLFSVMPLVYRETALQKGIAAQVLNYIAEHFTEPLTLESTAHELGISRIHLSHIFSQHLKINFRQHINTLRIEHACLLLQDPSHSVSQIAYLCGYNNARTFHRAFQVQCGVSPNQYRERNERQRFAENRPIT